MRTVRKCGTEVIGIVKLDEVFPKTSTPGSTTPKSCTKQAGSPQRKTKDAKRVAAGRKAKNKGKVGEREFAEFLRLHGYTNARRGQQNKGGSDSPDVVGLPGVHPEIKRTERGTAAVYAWLGQAIKDTGSSENVPIVFHRMNHKPWIVIMRAGDFLGYHQATQTFETMEFIAE